MTLLRSALFNLLFAALTVVLGLWGLALRLVTPRRALAGRAMRLARLWIRLTLAMAERICGISVVVTGREHLPADGGAALIASQHQSAFDTLVWFTIAARPAYVMKRELVRIPLVGPLLVATGQIAVDRSAGAAALRSLLRGAERAVAERRQIVIFPEGTRVEPGQHVSLHPGVAAIAAKTHLPVIPVATDSGRRWGRRAFRKQPGPIHVRILPPLPAELPRAELLPRLQSAWDAGALAVPPAAAAPAAAALASVDKLVG